MDSCFRYEKASELMDLFLQQALDEGLAPTKEVLRKIAELSVAAADALIDELSK